ncbi:hypothetical protein [Paraburkholderia sp. BL9I2N2]|uniref:hypothetical protein n=1 Tax=Paraburkholderia sp. BL9I2N2 TaxID=1938809 RepID=UPI001FB23725|nr:hypothetical protein [Paraburkholderia sp. BL9I2N2]
MTDRDPHLFHALRVAALLLLVQLPCAAAWYAGQPAWLDARVSQETVASTICHRGYLAQVMPSIDAQIRLKDKLLAQQGIAPSLTSHYALDFHMPVLLGGLAGRTRES